MLKKRIILALICMALLTGFFFLPENRTWAKKLLGYARELPSQTRKLDEVTRLTNRFGNGYTYSVTLAEMMKKNNEHDAVLLMPPTNYFTKRGLTYHVPEPAVFYYFTGIKTVWVDSREAINAEWFAHVEGKEIVISKGDNKKALQDTITAFKKYGVTL